MNNKLKVFSILAVLLLSAIMMSSCNNNKDTNSYINEELGFSLNIPSSMKNMTNEEVDGNTVTFYYGEEDSQEYIFRITRYFGMSIEDVDVKRLEGNEKILSKEYNATFTINYPFKLEDGDKDGANVSDEVYNSMNSIISSFKVIMEKDLDTDEKPDKFDYVGSVFFNMYIPNYFKFRESETELMTWEVTLKDKLVGKISFLPYGLSNPNEVNENLYIKYVNNNELRRTARIAFLKEYIENFNFVIVTDNFKFLPGPTNAMDILSDIKRMSSGNGQSSYGRITGINMSGGNIESVTFERILEEGETNSPGKLPVGSHTLKVANNAKVVAFAPPDFDKYDRYTFFEKAGDYFSTNDYNDYPSKLFYVSVNSAGDVVGFAAAY